MGRYWTQLRTLDISGNKIGTIPLFAAGLTTLKKLVVSANPLVLIPLHVEHVTHHTSHITRHTSHVTPQVIIPLQLGALVNLRRFEYDDHDRWISPPSSVMQQGAEIALV